jgi:DHA2 family multidrug resistance protein-like MFS transporter
MFSNGRFTLAALTSLASFVSQGITFVALPFLFQSVYGYSPVVSALLFTPWPIGIVLIAPHAGRWADTISAPLISTIGLMIFVGGLVLLATLPENPSAWNICLRSLVCGIGFGCFQSPNNREMLANVAREMPAMPPACCRSSGHSASVSAPPWWGFCWRGDGTIQAVHLRCGLPSSPRRVGVV